jgi:hypothetical protein
MISTPAFRIAVATLLMSVASGVVAQTCASPISIVSAGTSTGNTCSGSNQLPYIANGAIENSENQDIYFVHATNAQSVTLTVTPQAGVDLQLAICRNQCSTYATCTSVVDSGIAGAVQSAPLPDGPGDYFIIVGGTLSSTPSCGSYTLNLAAPD